MAAKANFQSVQLHQLRRVALVATTAAIAWAHPAAADIGNSFLQLPDAKGHYKGADHLGWIRSESDAWSTAAQHVGIGGFRGFGPGGPPRPGTAAELYIMVAKNSPDAALLMERCTKKAKIPEVGFAEPSGRAGNAFLELKLKDVQITSCPVVAGAVEQGFTVKFQDIAWLNAAPPAAVGAAAMGGGGAGGGRGASGRGGARPAGGTTQDQAGPNPRAGASTADQAGPGSHDVRPPDIIPAVLPVEPSNGKRVKDYLVTWMAPATDSTKEQCPVMSAKPNNDDFYRYLSPTAAAAQRAKYGEKGMVHSAETEWRGPEGMNVVLLPGIVPDPGLPEPKSTVAAGLNLDGDDGTGKPPAGIRKHKNYTSPSGVKGIDNEMYSVLACVPGYRGRDGYMNQTSNARRADGNITTIIEVSNISNDQNDDNVEVAVIHSMDKPIRDNVGKNFISGYTFRPSTDPRMASHNVRIHGRIVNGVIETDVIPIYAVAAGVGGGGPGLHEARMRIEPQPDGSIKMWIGGYIDWRGLADGMSSGYSEGLFNYQAPAVWYAFKRHADGLYNPVTGEYEGISAAYEIDGVPAFMTGLPKTAATAATAPAGK